MVSAAPLLRGSNRQAVLIPIELLAVLLLFAVWMRPAPVLPVSAMKPRLHWMAGVLAFSPLLLAIVQLTPLPAGWWTALAGHDIYPSALRAATGAFGTAWRPLSVSPDATAAALLAGVPVAAALLVGMLAGLDQLRQILRVVVVVGFMQVILGVLQMAGGPNSPLLFGIVSNRPIGTFANSNHFANYLCLALAAFAWLAYEADRVARLARGRSLFDMPAQAILWSSGALLLVMGVLMSLSRGAAIFGLPAACMAGAVAFMKLKGAEKAWRWGLPLVALVIAIAVGMVGLDTTISRAGTSELLQNAGYRGLLARSSLDAALAYFPWGAGWGTYDMVYPRFQPPEIAGFANHAHMDYVEMLLEGGVFFLILAACFAWLAIDRSVALVRSAWHERTLHREAIAAAVFGLALAGFLLHSLVEFNMRIPANAILAALFAGIFLRPLPPQDAS